jgi:nucleoside-diphosphate-sugar epimerase
LSPLGRYRFIDGDVKKIDLKPLLKDADVLIHLAAITDAAGTIDMPELLEANNFKATEIVAQACVESAVRLIALSSTSVYGSQHELVTENCDENELNPQSPYATTKLKEERMIMNLCETRGLKAVLFRFGTIFGTSPGMRFHTAVNKFCWQAVLDVPITVWSTAYDQKRPYLDLSDAIRAIAFFIQSDLFNGRIYNVVTKNFTVRQIVDTIRSFVPNLKMIRVDSPIMNQLSYEVSCDRILHEGFAFSGDIQTGIGETIALLQQAHSPIYSHRHDL